jgi:hypothetical protein
LLLWIAFATGCLTQLLLPATATAMQIAIGRAAAGICSVEASALAAAGEAAAAHAADAGHCAVCSFASTGGVAAALPSATSTAAAGRAAAGFPDGANFGPVAFLRPVSHAPPRGS